MYRYIILGIITLSLFSCKSKSNITIEIGTNPELYLESVKTLTDVMVHDIFSPPVASRIYAYATIGGYEAARWKDAKNPSLAGKIKHFNSGPVPDTGVTYNFELAATLTMLKIGKTLIFSEDTLQHQIDKVRKYYKGAGLADDIFDRSEAFSDSVVAHILRWAAKDNYKQTRSFPKYSIRKDPATWKPTPPGYMDGVEPSWNKIRPMLMDSAAQFKPEHPTPYNVKNKNSAYYKEMLETYLAVKDGTQEQKDIANFWDCNPYKLNVTGHVMHATKKISPGGHWMNIAGLACKKSGADFVLTTKANMMVAIGLFEAFISCWDEKYRSITVRPETVINEFVDQEWLPLLQTPPFPEYPSGHSVASGAASYILTNIFGDNFAFIDDTETEFGLEQRSFTSFNHAADEASVSRLYGGIHYMPAIKNGVSQGKKIGTLVVSTLDTK
jgi:hypothetical protein